MDFLLFHQEIFENFLKNSPANFFRQNARKFDADFWIVLKIDQNKAFFAIFKEIFEKFRYVAMLSILKLYQELWNFLNNWNSPLHVPLFWANNLHLFPLWDSNRKL